MLATFGFEDQLREGIVEVIDELYKGGTNTRIISGDHKDVVTHIAKQLGIADLDENGRYQGIISAEDLRNSIKDLFIEKEVEETKEMKLQFKG